MADRLCPHCGSQILDVQARWCARCGRPVAPAEGAAPEVSGPPTGERPAQGAGAGAQAGGPQASHAAEPVPPMAAAAPSRLPTDGQRRCLECGEALYRDDRVCWHCGRRVEPPPPEPEIEPGVPVGVPASGAPAAPAPPAHHTVWTQRLAAPPAPPEAMSVAWWSLALGLVSILTCGLLGVLGPIAAWLGVRASRRGAGPVAVAGIVLGLLGTLVLLTWLAFLAVWLVTTLRVGPSHVLMPLANWGALLCKT
ncbi:MAG: hypothetical protein AB7Y46_19640 [Armatimonadota bacterium]